MSKTPKLSHFLEYFPEVELPVTISEESILTFDSMNEVLPKQLIEHYIIKWEGNQEIDEYTEFIPCFRLPDSSEDYHAIVYWKGGLLKYEYLLVTIDKRKDTLITRKSIAGLISDGNQIKQSVAQIDEDLIIHIMAGINNANEDFNPQNSQAFNMEIMSTGDIIFTLGDQ